ncbi:MAG: class I poly(R)-hydroxyalkanoic acid synthase [Legionella sp.]|uniref:PHA/PHB synthase family protein n=1 Tax=Legionella sp. TaxID=459 RepID=UPI0039E654A3
MTQDKELGELLQAVAEKSLQIINDLQKKPLQLSALIQQYIDLTEHFQNVISVMLNNPEKVWQMQMDYWQDALELAHTQFTHWLQGAPMPIADNRFSGEDWLNNPFFNLLSQHYLLASEHMNTLFENMEYPDDKVARKLKFFTKQYLDALSPANFLHTNPQLMDETLKSHGKNLLHGLHNLLSDLEIGSSRISIKMTDTDAFKLGKNIAVTPGKVVFRNDMIELIQYTPTTAKVKSIPLLIIPPWINKYYILDLSPHNSFIRWIVDQGITVFVISWVNPDASFANKSLYDYLHEGPQAAIHVIQNQLKVPQVNALGFCIGGTLLSLLLAYNKAHLDNSIHSATFLAAMIDFSDPGDISVFIDEQQIKKLEEEMKSKGYLAGKFMASSFNSLRANDLVWSFFIKNYLRGQNPVPFDILYWNSDSTNMPATMHSQYLRWMYLHNDLVKPNKIHINHTPIDVRTIDIPTFFLSTEKDHIAPWKTTYIGYELMKGPKRFVLGGSGHIAGIVNPPSVTKYGYKVNDQTNISAEEWIENAVEYAGSWWNEWATWLKNLSGSNVLAPDFIKMPYKPLMDAPGSYVLEK